MQVHRYFVLEFKSFVLHFCIWCCVVKLYDCIHFYLACWVELSQKPVLQEQTFHAMVTK